MGASKETACGRRRSYAGEGNPRAKLNAADVRAIRRDYAAGTMGVALARRYGVTTATISMIVNRKLWTKVR